MEFIKIAERSEKYKPTFTSSGIVADYMGEANCLDREALWALHLDTNLQIIKKELVGLGGLSFCSITPREILKQAIISDCKAIILVHNHPSGNTTPSNEDIKLTKLVVRAGKLFSIDILDHIIIGPNKTYFSMADSKIL